MPRYYVRLGLRQVHENLPDGQFGTLTYQGSPVFYLNANGTLSPSPFQRYFDFYDATNDIDYDEIEVIEVYEERPAGFNTGFIAGAGSLIAGWGVIDTDGTITPPDDGGGGGGGGGVTPPPTEPDPPAEVYMGRWSDHWIDGNGIVHYFPYSGGYAPLYPVIHQQTLAQIESVLIEQNGIADPVLFATLARWLGIESSAGNRARSTPAAETAADAFAALVYAGLNVADALTRTDQDGNFTGAYMTEVRDFWAAQRAARLSFEAGLANDPDFAGLTDAGREAIVRLLTGHKVFISEGYNRDVIADRGYFVALATELGWTDVPDRLATVVGSIRADHVEFHARGAAVSGPGADRIIQTAGESGTIVFAGAGNDVVNLRGADTPDRTSHVDGEAGRDRLTGSRHDDKLLGGGGADRLFGLGGIDTLTGGAGADRIEGAAGRDILRSGDGNDILLGGRGADRLTGGTGSDRMTGGRDQDRFIFDTARTGQDRILDFTDGQDRIVLGSAAARSMADLELRRVDADTVVLDLQSGRITVDGTGALTLTRDDFMFL